MAPMLKGTCFSGAKSSPEQQKKHFSMMTREELLYLKKWAQRRPMEAMTVTNHVREKVSVAFNPHEVKRILEDGNLEHRIIEFNQKLNFRGKSRRILIRDAEATMVTFTRNGRAFQAEGNLCIVVDLDHWCLVTAYWNLASDNHPTVNWERYTPELSVME